jgi:hypothetical protein
MSSSLYLYNYSSSDDEIDVGEDEGNTMSVDCTRTSGQSTVAPLSIVRGCRGRRLMGTIG